MRTLEQLHEEYKDCQRCDLSQSRKVVMFGDGDPNARVVLLAERVGGYDEERGHLFSGPAGELLDKILAAPGVEIPKEDVYITNLVLCRAPKDRSPKVGEIRACQERLFEQLEIISLKLLVAMGRLPMLYFLNLKGRLEENRGWHEFQLSNLVTVKTFLTFNPASALYGQPEDIKYKKRLMYDDWKQVGNAYREIIQ